MFTPENPRLTLLTTLAAKILTLEQPCLLRIGIDGVDGAGKTTFADELARELETSGRQIIRASVDSFHNPRAVRYAKGRSSPEGYYRDSFNYAVLAGALLDPLGAGGNLRYQSAVFDHRTDLPVSVPERQAMPDAILVFDGIFLHRPELRDYWDFSVFLDVPFDVSIARCALRDGSSPDPLAAENRRYIEGQQLYLREAEPQKHASAVVDNRDLDVPYIIQG